MARLSPCRPARGPRLSRRDWLKLSAAGVVGYSLSGWMPLLAADTATDPRRKRSCILLWMDGGPSQMDTFDLKPGSPNGGPFKEIDTAAPGVRISEHFPKIAQFTDRMAIIRSMTTKEGEHQRAHQLMHTGTLAQDQIQYPTLGSLISHELDDPAAVLPGFVSVAPNRAVAPQGHTPGFLGPNFAALFVCDGGPATLRPGQGMVERSLRVQNLEPPRDVPAPHLTAREGLLEDLENDFVKSRPGAAGRSHLSAYEKAVRLMHSDAGKAFDLDEEKDSARDAYGRNLFGQGCLLARRLVERGVPFIEVALGGLNGGGLGWDTHTNNFETVKSLSQVLDAAWSALMGDLKERGLLDTTLIVWMGEFGRTPQINPQKGRDHFPNGWSTVLAGGGIKGGQAVGKTGKNGGVVEERPVMVTDFLATVCLALGVDPMKQNNSNVDRPIRIVDKSANPVKEVLE
jgi:Protein of unknown function (DUF1501)